MFRARGEHRFPIPAGSHWGDVLAVSEEIDKKLTDAMRAVADANTELHGVFTVDWNQPAPDASGKKLTIAPEDQAIEQAKQLIQQARQEAATTLTRNKIIEIIATIAVYKFTNRSREEVETMLGLNIEESRVYQDIVTDTKLEIVPGLLAEGMSIEKVAQLLKLSIEKVRQVAQQSNS